MINKDKNMIKNKSSNHITAQNLKSLLDAISSSDMSYHIPISNTQAIKNFLTNRITTRNTDFSVEFYEKGDEVVNSGYIVSDKLKTEENFIYADVPLGFILKGEVVVVKGAKGTKKLGVGDFIGLFETSDWILTHKTRQIGDWTLIANADTEILYFGASVLNENDKNTENLRNYLVELARADRVPQPITTLPLLDWVASHTTRSRLNDYAIVVHTHILPNNLPFLRHLSYLVGFGRIYVLEKPYSTVRETYNELIQAGFEVIPVSMDPGVPYEFSVKKSLEILWAKVIEEQKKTNFKNILVVDEGGDVWLSIPWTAFEGVNIAGVEQTQRGITRIRNSHVHIPPIVSVASSGIKKIIESEFIGESVVKKLDKIGILSSTQQIGIVGMGNIGSAIVNALEVMSKKPIFYDSKYHTNPPKALQARASLDSLINESNLIIGTTGGDSLKGIALERISGNKIFVSASSADVEFASLLKLAQPTSTPFDTIRVLVHDKLTIDILNGGYPINFDRTQNATPSEDIVLTRCLMYIGAMQAAQLIFENIQMPGIYNLDHVSQKKLLEQWIKDKTNAGKPPRITQLNLAEIIGFNPLIEGKDMPSVWQE